MSKNNNDLNLDNFLKYIFVFFPAILVRNRKLNIIKPMQITSNVLIEV